MSSMQIDQVCTKCRLYNRDKNIDLAAGSRHMEVTCWIKERIFSVKVTVKGLVFIQ